MNQYNYNEIEIGQKESFSVTVTKENQDAFRLITGDSNPLHGDGVYAVKMGYEGCVVFGMLTASYYSTLAGVYLPGKYSLLHHVNSKFIKPVYIGDTLTISGCVTDKNDTFQIITVKATISNQYGVKVSKAEMQIGIIR